MYAIRSYYARRSGTPGRIPEIVYPRLAQLDGQGVPTVAVVLYGNRAYEDALLELADLLRQRGCQLVAAGAFIGEHSYSTAEHPTAANRPDESDLRNNFV